MITSPSKKSYIGLTCETNIDDRWEGHLKSSSHCTLLKRAINKYGWDNLKKKILIEFKYEINDKLLPEYEKRFIKVYNTLAPNGYNCTDGGEGGKKLCEETKQNIGKGVRQYFNSIEIAGTIRFIRNKYVARCGKDGKRNYIGTYTSEELARKAINQWRESKTILQEGRIIKNIGFIKALKNGSFTAYKNSKKIGSFKTREEAQKYIDEYIKK